MRNAQMPGAGQVARAEAREKVKHTKQDSYRQLAFALAHHGPSTRRELAMHAGMKVNTVNGRIAEMRDLPVGHEWRVITHGRRDGEGICHLASVGVPHE